ncbi:hypothetical protein [Pelobacter propionicus]|jgi:hypothetical protein|uniref:Lipoprotein n=1 Tax=Pelobacter propionicus (strain DSM 2379 / NBRC 103807 / OttBd1) TaxID=338966 RepID=A0R7Q4_PELPD|nr:hypothetical protein [Pelobacter propionicus]ABL01362.1 hypothetical protein Ppro_3773 [Pelobacter propionicus DSM 2379]
MLKKFIAYSALVALVSGCAGNTTRYQDARTVSSINSLAGVPYAGYLGVAAMAADVVSKVGKPKTGVISPGIMNHLLSSPMYLEKWIPRKKNGVLLTVENTPQISRDYTETYAKTVPRLIGGDFGDGGEVVVKKNIEAWRDGKRVVAEYHGPNGVKVICVSDNNKPFNIMTREEWENQKDLNK